MVKRRALHRVALNDEDDHLLDQASALFGLTRSEVVRRLLRAAMETGPAFNAETTNRLQTLAQQLRGVGRELGQIHRAIANGRPVVADESEPVWRSLLAYTKEVEAELIRAIRTQGAELRKAAMLEDGGPR